jgi:hypothetical protein
MSQLTPEQIAANKAEADAKKKLEQETKAAEKKVKADEKAAAAKLKKENDAKARDEAKAKKLAEAQAVKDQREADKKAKADAKAAKVAERENSRMPEQNGVRRPKADTLCGKAWGIADKLSASLGQPVPIANLLEATTAEGLNEGNVKAEYARWRKFHGVTGRVALPKPAETPAPAPVQ